MGPISPIPIFRFSTLVLPVKERFNAWTKDIFCDCRLRDNNAATFDAESSGAALGPFILSGRRWLNSKGTAPYELRRTARLIRADGQDFFWLSLVVKGCTLSRSARSDVIQTAGDLRFADAAQPHECEVETGEVISLALPRDFLPSHAGRLHGHILSGGMGRLLGDHLLSLYRNLPNLREQDVPYVVQSTLQLVTAVVCPTEEAAIQASSPIRDALIGRIQRYIDAHFLEADLTPDRICRDIGLSRAKLYQLFEGKGGVMRQVQCKRLRSAYRTLTDPNRPRTRIAELAWQHGFPNEQYFYRMFKAEFGHTPSETLARALSPNSSRNEVTLGCEQEKINLPNGWTLPFGVLKG